jgi:hypothetical protein
MPATDIASSVVRGQGGTINDGVGKVNDFISLQTVTAGALESGIECPAVLNSEGIAADWRGGRVAEGARLESVFRGNSNVSSNLTLSAISLIIKRLIDYITFHVTRQSRSPFDVVEIPTSDNVLHDAQG